MIQINDKKYCCFLVGSGLLGDEYFCNAPIKGDMPSWIQDQGEFKIENQKWNIAVGISHEDEEWRQDDDIKEFMIGCYSFLDEIMNEGSGSLTLVMTYTKDKESMCSLNSSTAGLLSLLKINLEIHWMFDLKNNKKTEQSGAL